MVTVSFDARELRLDTSEDAEQICKELVDKDVEILILQGNTFGIEAAERVGMELAKQSKLKEAHFKDIFTSRGREEIPDALRHLLQGIIASGSMITLLDLSDNAIGPIGAPSVIEFLNSPSAQLIEKLYVNNCGWGPEGSTSLATTIPQLRNLREFICGRSRLENKGASNMSRALLELNNLEVLRFNQNGIKVEGILELVKVLQANAATIRDIDLSDNWVKTEGSKALAEVIGQATNLEHIFLSDAYLENEDFEEICKGIARLPTLSNLKSATFEGNDLHGMKIVDTIMETFTNCDEKFTLNLLENDFKPDQLRRLQSLEDYIEILVDDADDEDYDEEDEEEDEDEESADELRQLSQEFIKEAQVKPLNAEKTNQAFLQLIEPAQQFGFEAIQILGEELGLIKSESTRNKKPLACDAMDYITKRLDDLPVDYRSFFKSYKQLSNGVGKV